MNLGSQLSTSVLPTWPSAAPSVATATSHTDAAHAVAAASRGLCFEQSQGQAASSACSVAAAKAGLLLRQLLHPAALLRLLGLQRHYPQDMAAEQHTPLAVAQPPQPAQAVSLPHEAADCEKLITAATQAQGLPQQPLATSNSVMASGCDHEQMPPPQQQQAEVVYKPSLLAMLGLAAGPGESLVSQADAADLEKVEGEDLGQRVARLGGITLALVEVLLSSLVTQPQVFLHCLVACLLPCTPSIFHPQLGCVVQTYHLLIIFCLAVFAWPSMRRLFWDPM